MTTTETSAESITLNRKTVTCEQACSDCGSVTFVQAEGGCDDLPVTCLDCDGE